MAKTAFIAAFLSIAAASPAMAQQDSADWWLVYGKDGAATAQFIDLAAIQRTAGRANVTILAVDRAGKEQRHAVVIRCDDAKGADAKDGASVPAFVCGTDAYRAQNGLNVRDFPPAALAKIYFDTRKS